MYREIEITNITELITHKIHLLISTETQLRDALPLKETTSQNIKLRKTIELHLQQTENQINRLKKIMAILNIRSMNIKDDIVEAMIELSERLILSIKDPILRDFAMIASLKQVEMYEILCYKTLIEMVRIAGLKDTVPFLLESIKEEEVTLDKIESIGNQFF